MYVLLSEINNSCPEGLPGWYIYPPSTLKDVEAWHVDTVYLTLEIKYFWLGVREACVKYSKIL